MVPVPRRALDELAAASRRAIELDPSLLMAAFNLVLVLTAQGDSWGAADLYTSIADRLDSSTADVSALHAPAMTDRTQLQASSEYPASVQAAIARLTELIATHPGTRDTDADNDT